MHGACWRQHPGTHVTVSVHGPCSPLSGSVPPPCRTEAFLQGVFAQSKGLQAARGAQRGLEMLGR